MSRIDKNLARINDISKVARRTGEMAAQWGVSVAQWERAILGMRRQLADLGADEHQIERIIRSAREGYNSVDGDEEWVVVQRLSGRLDLVLSRDYVGEVGDIICARGSRSKALLMYRAMGGSVCQS